MFPAAHGIVDQGGVTSGGGGAEEHTGITSWTTPGSAVVLSGRLGWVFQVTDGPITVTKLRTFTGAAGNATWRVMIHRNSDDAVMTQADIVTNASGQWFEMAVTPVALADDDTYTISARLIGATSTTIYRNPTGVVYASQISLVDDGVSGAASDDRPTGATGNAYTPMADMVFTL